MAMDLPYPAVLGEFLGVLGSLQITHEDRDLLVSMVHLDVSANVKPQSVFSDHGQASSLQSPAASSHTINGRQYNVTKRRRQAGYTSARGTKVLHGQRKLHNKVRSQTLASQQVQDPVRVPCIAPDAIESLSEDGHCALVMPWQSSDLPLWVTEMNSENSASSAVHEVARDATPGSFFSSDRSTPSEIRTEQHERSSDYIKIPWSEQDRK